MLRHSGIHALKRRGWGRVTLSAGASALKWGLRELWRSNPVGKHSEESRRGCISCVDGSASWVCAQMADGILGHGGSTTVWIWAVYQETGFLDVISNDIEYFVAYKGYLHRINRRCSLRSAVRARPDLLGVSSLNRFLSATT